MLGIIKNIFSRSKTGQLPLGRWARNSENVKSIYANSDHCGDIICGDPKKVKKIVQKTIKLPQNNKLDMYKNEEFCCMLFGVNGPCINCGLISNVKI
jgi:hypothetical protein|tara:strand:+ start:329 stop:619 length:291 start_codon:yes stop_codon:yes gene_type:complete